MAALLILDDADTARDVLTFFGRARQMSDEGVRLQASRGILALTTAVLFPEGLFDQTPTVLGMRIVRADAELECDIVVDELAAAERPEALVLPDTGRAPSWAGVSPPRSGWEQRAELASSVVASRAQWGASAIARMVGSDAGAEAVRVARVAVWGEPDELLLGLPRGVAFAAEVLGFLGEEESVAVSAAGRWTRLTFRRGHVLSRGPVATGLTPIRTTARGAVSDRPPDPPEPPEQ